MTNIFAFGCLGASTQKDRHCLTISCSFLLVGLQLHTHVCTPTTFSEPREFATIHDCHDPCSCGVRIWGKSGALGRHLCGLLGVQHSLPRDPSEFHTSCLCGDLRTLSCSGTHLSSDTPKLPTFRGWGGVGNVWQLHIPLACASPRVLSRAVLNK